MTRRTLHVSQPVEAGVPAVVAALVADQLARGDDVHVACPPGAGLAATVTGLGAVHHSWAATRSPGATVPDEVRRLRQIIDQVDPDVVVLHSAKAGLAGRLALRGSRPTVYAPHAWSFEAVGGPVRTASTAWEVAASRWTDVVVCVSEDERDRGLAAGVTAPMVVVGNGVDLQALRPAEPGPARARLGLADRPTVVCVGRLSEQKGQDQLLAGWPAVLAAVPDAQLVLVGDGPARAALEASAPLGVLFTGARSDIADVLTAADVVALPSRWEAAPLVPLEAMAVGRTVVAFGVDGVRAALGDTGVVLEPGDVPGLAAALIDLLTDPSRTAAEGRAARARVERTADVHASTAAWDDVLTAVAGPAPRTPLRITSVPSLGRLLLGGGTARVDVAAVDGSTAGARLRAAGLSALGVPVWWRGSGSAPPALGAPVLTGALDDDALSAAARRPGAGSADGPAVSVVVTVLNEGDALRRLVDEVLPQLREDDELVLVDGGSTDGSVAALPAAPALRVEIVPGAGISAGRNHGIRVARNEVVICTDAGCTVEPGFVDAFRSAFAVADPPALVSGVYRVLARDAMEEAQALACYPQPAEVRRPDLLVRSYTRVFGTGFDPRFAVGRCLAFTREAWKDAGGFPEHLATGEDVSFGLAIARSGAVRATTDAVVGWTQRDGLAATWRMYRGYGRASTDGGDTALLARDAARGLAYLAAPVLALSPTGRRLLAAGAAAYLSLPVVRALRAGAGPATVALLPVALATKDVGKLAGAVQGLLIRRAR
jgi:glycosyltransferase involved in cell wall biosynthesis